MWAFEEVDEEWWHFCLHPVIRAGLRRRGLLRDFERVALSLGKTKFDLASDFDIGCQDRDSFGYHVESLVELGFTADELVQILRYERPSLKRIQ